jgi:hypothetical protein
MSFPLRRTARTFALRARRSRAASHPISIVARDEWSAMGRGPWPDRSRSLKMKAGDGCSRNRMPSAKSSYRTGP